MSALSFCLGVLALTCQQPAVELEFVPGAQPIPHEVQVASRGAQTTVFLGISGATFADLPTVTGASVVGSSPNAVQAAGPGALSISNILLNVAGSDVGDEIRAHLRIIDPNAGVVLAEQTVTLASVRGVDRFAVPFFNPASNHTQETLLRLVAEGGDVVAVITGRDDAGNRSRKGEVLVRAGSGITLNATQAEALLGPPVGKYRLTIDTDGPGLIVQGLVRNASTGTISAITDSVEAH